MNNSDISFQRDFILNNAWRLVSAHDDDIASPSYGCAHYSYWRDKTSEFPDARYQEAGATLGILCSSEFDHLFAELGTSSLICRDELYSTFSASLNYLAKIQYSDGCFDEWYKGERGFAATEFTTIAFGLAGIFLADRLLDSDRKTLTQILKKSSSWLSFRRDLAKANHQAAAAAALSITSIFLNDDALMESARKSANDVLSRQTTESWFPEIGGMDLGYCSVLLDYVMIYHHFSGDFSVIEPMKKLFKFMSYFINPNLTIMKEYGLCLNPYLSRLGIGLLSKFSDEAAFVVNQLTRDSVGIAGLRPYLADDLRFFRWSYLPLVTNIFSSTFRSLDGNLRAIVAKGWYLSPLAQTATYQEGDLSVYFAPCSGGSIEIYLKKLLVFKSNGPVLEKNGVKWSSSGYSNKRTTTISRNRISLTSFLRKSNYYYPGFFPRLLLRIGCIFAWSSSLTRKIIDYLRVKSSSAINQSAAPIFNTDRPINFERIISVESNSIKIIDRVYFEDRNPTHFTVKCGEKFQPNTIEFDQINNTMSIIFIISI